MSIDDLVYTLGNSELYQFVIDEVEYDRIGNMGADILIRSICSWEVTKSEVFEDLYTLYIYTWNYFQNEILSNLESVCFNGNQLNAMVKSGASIANITDMTLEIDSVKKLYSEQGFNKEKVRPIIYEYYANKLVEKLNGFILGKEDL